MMTITGASMEQGRSRIMSVSFQGSAPTVDKLHDENIVDCQYEVMKLIKSITLKHRGSGICPQSTFGGYLNKEDTINLSYFSLVLLEISNLYQYWTFSFVFGSIE
jgi:hypothetical protein